MPRDNSVLPGPLAAAVGLVTSGIANMRHLPSAAIRLPVMTVGYLLVATEKVRREYEEFEQRGRAVLGRSSDDASGSGSGGWPSATTLREPAGGADFFSGGHGAVASAVAEVRDGLETAADRVERAAQSAAGDHAAAGADEVGEQVVEQVGEEPAPEEAAPEPAAGPAGRPAAEPPQQAAQPPEQDQPARFERHDTAADEATRQEVAEAVDDAPAPVGADALAPQNLPLPDFDHMTLGSLRGRLRRLSLEDLIVLRDWEQAHADRLPVVTMLDNRIAKLHRDAQSPVATASS